MGLFHQIVCLFQTHRLLFEGILHSPDIVHRFIGLLLQGLYDSTYGFGAFPALFRKSTYFPGHHRKSPAGFPCPGCFYGSIQAKQVGLLGNAVDHINCLPYFLRRLICLHGI